MKKLFTLVFIFGAAGLSETSAAEVGRFTFSGTLYQKEDGSNALPASPFTGTTSYEAKPDNQPINRMAITPTAFSGAPQYA